MRTVDYVIDAYGNLKSRSRGATDPPLAGFEFDFTVDAATNRITADAEAAGLAWSYDLNGNAVRFKGQAGQQVSALWDARNRMTGFVEGDVTQGVPPAEWYADDADGYRWLRMGKDGKAQLTLRDVQGTALADYIEGSGPAGPQLIRHLIPALGRIIAERRPAGTPPTLTSSSTANSGGSFPLTVTDGYAAPSYEVDISARSGFRNHLSGVTLDAQHGFLVPETALSPGETNMVRIRAAGAEPTGYSAPVALLYDPSVGPSSSNQVRALTASRSGTNIVIRWALGQSNGKRFNVRFQREDTGATYLLTPTPLSASTRSLTLAAQSLSQPCVLYLLSQEETGSAPGLGNPAGASNQQGMDDPCGPGGGGSPPPPPPSTPQYTTWYHHHDHLGSLRMVTDSAGIKVAGYDYYPYGTRMEDGSNGSSDGDSDRRYTGHERDLDTGLDYMVARYYGPMLARFLSTDAGDDTYLDAPQSWNKYVYVRDNPVNANDPDGEIANWIVGGAIGAVVGGVGEAIRQGVAGEDLNSTKHWSGGCRGARFGRRAGGTFGASLIAEGGVFGAVAVGAASNPDHS